MSYKNDQDSESCSGSDDVYNCKRGPKKMEFIEYKMLTQFIID